MYFEFLFFFFKQKTAYEMRISDWSSDVCSSDLTPSLRAPQPAAQSRKCDEQTHPKRVIPAPGSKSGTSSAKRSAGTYHYPFEHRCSSRHPVGPGAARLRRLDGMPLSTERIVAAKFIKRAAKHTRASAPGSWVA